MGSVECDDCGLEAAIHDLYHAFGYAVAIDQSGEPRFTEKFGTVRCADCFGGIPEVMRNETV